MLSYYKVRALTPLVCWTISAFQAYRKQEFANILLFSKLKNSWSSYYCPIWNKIILKMLLMYLKLWNTKLSSLTFDCKNSNKHYANPALFPFLIIFLFLKEICSTYLYLYYIMSIMSMCVSGICANVGRSRKKKIFPLLVNDDIVSEVWRMIISLKSTVKIN